MLTKDPRIGSAEYWDEFYTGKNESTQDNSKTVRPANAFDRFAGVIKHIHDDDKKIIDVGSGHGKIVKMIKDKWPIKDVLATDQSSEAKKAANFEPYQITSGYNLCKSPGGYKWDLLIITQALEYIEDQDRFMQEAKRVAKKILITCPAGEMKAWSQFRIYTEENLKEFIEKYATIEIFENWGAILMVKAKFYE